MAFDAGRVTATLDLDRSPFQRALDLSIAQGQKFDKSVYEATLAADVEGASAARSTLEQLETRARRVDGTDVDIDVNVDQDGGGVASLGRFTGALSSSMGSIAQFNQKAAFLRNLTGYALPIAIAGAVSAFGPLIGAAGAAAGAAVGLGAGFGLIAAATAPTISILGGLGDILNDLTLEERRSMTAAEQASFVQKELAKDGVNLSDSQKEVVEQAIRVGRAFNTSFAESQGVMDGVLLSVGKLAEDALPFLGRQATRVTESFAIAFGGVLGRAQEPEQLATFRRFFDRIPSMIESATTALGNFGLGLFNMLVETMPYADRLLNWIQDVSKRFLEWSQSEKGRRQIQQFMRGVARYGPIVANAIAEIGRVLGILATSPVVRVFFRALIYVISETAREIRTTIRVIEFLYRGLGKAGRAAVNFGKGVIRWIGRALEIVKRWRDRIRGDIGDATKGAIDRAISFFRRLPGRIANFLGGVIERVRRWGRSLRERLSESVRDAVRRALTWWGNLISGVARFLGRVLARVRSWARSLRERLSDGIRSAVDRALNWFRNLPYRVGYFLGRVIVRAIDFARRIRNFLTDGVRNAVQGALRWFANLPGRAARFLANVIDRIRTWGRSLRDRISSAVRGAVEAALRFFANLPVRAARFLSNVIERVRSWGRSLISRLAGAVRGAVDSAVRWFLRLDDRIRARLVSIIDRVRSWGSDMIARFADIGRTVRERFSAALRALVAYVREIFSNMISTVRTLVGRVRDEITSGFAGTRDRVRDALGGIVTAASEVFKSLLGAASSTLTNLKNIFADWQFFEIGWNLIIGLRDGFVSGASHLYRAARDVIGNFLDGVRAAAREGSPSRETFDRGVRLGEGLVLGWLSQMENARRGARELVGAMLAETDREIGAPTIGGIGGPRGLSSVGNLGGFPRAGSGARGGRASQTMDVGGITVHVSVGNLGGSRSDAASDAAHIGQETARAVRAELARIAAQAKAYGPYLAGGVS